MKKIIFIIVTLIMFFSKNVTSAEYDKIFFNFKINDISGDVIDLRKYENKVVLVVNTASYCGFTKQYGELQKLWENYKSEGLIVLGIPTKLILPFLVRVCRSFKLPSPPIPISASNFKLLMPLIIKSDTFNFLPFL